MASLIDLQPGEKIVTILPVRNLTEEDKNILFATRNGTVKKTPLKDFSNVQSRGIIAIGIDKDDELITARITDGHQVIFLATHDGMAIRFDEQDLRPMGRPAFGPIAASTSARETTSSAPPSPPPDEARNKQRLERAAISGKKDLVNQLEAVLDEAGHSTAPLTLDEPGELSAPAVSDEVAAKLEKLDKQLGLTPCLILSVTENGFGKRTDVDQYRLQSRGGKGVINVKTTAKNGKVSGINLVDETSELMVISQFGKIIRIDTKSIRAAGRSTQGVKLLDLEDQDKVAAAVVIPPKRLKSAARGWNAAAVDLHDKRGRKMFFDLLKKEEKKVVRMC